jgi:hypothetical protein
METHLEVFSRIFFFGKRVPKYLFKSKNENSGGEKETRGWEEKIHK